MHFFTGWKKTKQFIALSCLIPCFHLLSGCKEAAVKTAVTDPRAADSTEIKNLVQQVYAWQVQRPYATDYPPQENAADNYFHALNWEEHNRNLAAIKASGFFSRRFLDRYQGLAVYLDRQLKTGQVKWEKGDLPPYSDGSNRWCNCQDYPENFPSALDLHFNELAGTKAEADISWLPGQSYRMRFDKVGNKWFISSLEGFEKDGF